VPDVNADEPDVAYPGALAVEAHRLGRVVWACEAVAVGLGEVLGRSGDGPPGFVPDDSQIVDLARRIRRHASASTVLRARLPELREFPVATLTSGEPLVVWRQLVASFPALVVQRVADADDVATTAIAAALSTVAQDASVAGAVTLRRHLPVLIAELSSPPSVMVAEPLVDELLVHQS
jgi:hypothetical protein